MAQKILALINLQLPAGQATPAPPVGPALGQHGVNIMAFVKEYNAKTASQGGTIIPAQITVYEDRSFSFITKTPPASELLRKAAKVSKGSASPRTDKVAFLSRSAIKEIAETKMTDLNAADIEAAMKIVEGSARSMGIEVRE